MKKIIAILSALILTVVITACGTKSESKDKLEAIKEKGKIVLGVSPDYPPYEFYQTENGQQKIVGADIELAQEIAKSLGVELEITEMQFDALLPALKSGRIDMIISGMNPNEERRKAVDFSDVYYASSSVFVLPKESADITSVDDIKNKKIGVQKGTIQEKYLLETLKMDQSNIQALADVPNVIQDLKNKNIDAVFLADDVSYISISKEDSLEVSKFKLEEDAETDGVAVALEKGNNEKLLAEINKVVAKVKENDGFKNLLKKYGDIAVSQMK